MCFVWIWEQRAIISPYSINWLVWKTETECVYCEVQTGYLNVIWVICFIWIWEQTAIISLYSINWLICITETESVYCAVRTGSLNVIWVNLHVQKVTIFTRQSHKCLKQPGTNKEPSYRHVAVYDSVQSGTAISVSFCNLWRTMLSEMFRGFSRFIDACALIRHKQRSRRSPFPYKTT